MNREADICSALIHNRKLRLFSAVADVVGISERELADQVGRLCADGVLRRDRDYLLIANEAKAKAVAKGVPKVANSAAEERVAARMAANAVKKAADDLVERQVSLSPQVENILAGRRGDLYETPVKPSPVAVAAPAKRRAVPVPVPVPTAFTIEKGIPIPAKRWGKVAAVCPWPFLQMEVGDSFAVPVPDDMKPTQVAGALRKAVNSMRCRRMPGLRVTEQRDPPADRQAARSDGARMNASPTRITWTLARGGSEEHHHSTPIAQVTAETREQAIVAFAKQIVRGLVPPTARA